MASPPILGPIAFESFEVPEHIAFGGRQRLVVHTLPGGRRIVDTMGPDDAPIRWSGVFSGQNADGRVRALDLLRRVGAPLLLSWDSWLFNVLIADFEVRAAGPAWMPYRIELCVVPGLGDLLVDWLSSATAPAVTLPVLSGSVLDGAIGTAEAGVGGSSLPGVIAASGQLAHYVTMRAFAGGSG